MGTLADEQEIVGRPVVLNVPSNGSHAMAALYINACCMLLLQARQLRANQIQIRHVCIDGTAEAWL
jgi:hypothetical protein